jgi:hypothetical protein
MAKIKQKKLIEKIAKSILFYCFYSLAHGLPKKITKEAILMLLI